MSQERFSFNKFHIDRTWKNNFTNEALIFLVEHRKTEVLYEKLNMFINNPEFNEIGIDYIFIIDNINNDDNKIYNSILVASDNKWYKYYDNMLFNNGDFIRAAIQNLQSDNEALKEISIRIIKGDGIVYDPNIAFPYSLNSFKGS